MVSLSFGKWKTGQEFIGLLKMLDACMIFTTPDEDHIIAKSGVRMKGGKNTALAPRTVACSFCPTRVRRGGRHFGRIYMANIFS